MTPRDKTEAWDMRTRPTNAALCAAFRDLLTNGFFARERGTRLDAEAEARVLAQTKAWRNELWLNFAELERRLCPTKGGSPRG